MTAPPGDQLTGGDALSGADEHARRGSRPGGDVRPGGGSRAGQDGRQGRGSLPGGDVRPGGGSRAGQDGREGRGSLPGGDVRPGGGSRAGQDGLASGEGFAGPSPEDWLSARRVLAGQRLALGSAAARLYEGLPQVAGTGLLGPAHWLPQAPVPLEDLVLRWDARPATPAVDPAGPLTAHVRPRVGAGGGRQHRSYAEAIAALDRPALFEDRACYRLLDAQLTGRPELTFGACRYFDGVNLGHAVAHELAAAWLAGQRAPALAALPLRAAAGDPCDLPRRCATVALTTLTLRRDPAGGATFLLHWRDPARVNHAGGLYQVMPAGIFQPVTDTRAALRADLSLWHCLAREFSEELLGTGEEYPTSDGVLDYQGWPFHQRLAAARDAGRLTVWCVGAGVDPLTLATDILTVAVLDGDAFDELFGGLVSRNAEGRIVTDGGSAAIPFTGGTVARFSGGGEPVQTAGAALLRLAWQHRAPLLS